MIHHTCEQYAEHLRMPIPLAMDKAAKRRAMAGDNVVSGFVRQQRSFKMVCLVTCRRAFQRKISYDRFVNKMGMSDTTAVR